MVSVSHQAECTLRPNVRYGSKADIQRHSHLCPLSGAKRTSNVRLYEPIDVKAVLVGCALPVFLFFGSRVVSGSCDDVHVSCEDRINLYPAAPFRLATMLCAWTIALRWDGANLFVGTLAKRTWSHTSDPLALPAQGR